MILFVVGASRSGTTMMSRILGNASEAMHNHELHFFSKLKKHEFKQPLSSVRLAELGKYLIRAIEFDVWEKPDHFRVNEIFENLRLEMDLNGCELFEHITDSYLSKNGKSVFIDQTPENYLYLRQIMGSINNTKTVFMRRDPRAVVCSQKNRWQKRFKGLTNIPLRHALSLKFKYNPILNTVLWRNADQHSLILRQNSDVCLIDFGNFIHSPVSEIQKLCSYIGISFSEDMLLVDRKGSSNNPTETKNGIDTDVDESWKTKLNPGELFWISIISQQFDFSIKLTDIPKMFFIALWYILLLPLNIVLPPLLDGKKYLKKITQLFFSR